MLILFPSFALLVMQMIPQLKLSLAQLVALRVQHTRTPLDQLKRLVSGDVRANTNTKYVDLFKHDAVHVYMYTMISGDRK